MHHWPERIYPDSAATVELCELVNRVSSQLILAFHYEGGGELQTVLLYDPFWKSHRNDGHKIIPLRLLCIKTLLLSDAGWWSARFVAVRWSCATAAARWLWNEAWGWCDTVLWCDNITHGVRRGVCRTAEPVVTHRILVRSGRVMSKSPSPRYFI